MIGKWNKSVILTYIGVIISVVGIVLCFSLENGAPFAMICLMLAGICDLFDGVVARKCERTQEEKAFGIELDSLADVVDFTALPIAVFLRTGLYKWYFVVIVCIFAVFSVARLAFFNISADSEAPVKYYRGLPVTFNALILPIFYLFSLFMSDTAFKVFFAFVVLAVSFLHVIDFKLPKPKGKAYIFFCVLAIVMLFVYIFLV